MMNNTNDDEERKKRREVWIALFGALLLGGFLLFGAFQAQIFPGFNAAAQGVRPTAVPTRSSVPIVVVPPVIVGNAPTATAVPATPTATAVPATPTATTSAKEAPLTVPFINTNGVTSVQSYTGPTTITVSGTGQAQGKQFSDAFYLYANGKGQATSPVHSKGNGSLCIDSKPIDNYVQTIPTYNPEHTYTITLNAPGGPIKFGVCDAPANFGDNTGSFTITFD